MLPIHENHLSEQLDSLLSNINKRITRLEELIDNHDATLDDHNIFIDNLNGGLVTNTGYITAINRKIKTLTKDQGKIETRVKAIEEKIDQLTNQFSNLKISE